MKNIDPISDEFINQPTVSDDTEQDVAEQAIGKSNETGSDVRSSYGDTSEIPDQGVIDPLLSMSIPEPPVTGVVPPVLSPTPRNKSYAGLVVAILSCVILLAGLGGATWYYYDNYALKSDYRVGIDKYNEFNIDQNKDKSFMGEDLMDMSDEDIVKVAKQLKDMEAHLATKLDEFSTLRVNKDDDVKQAYVKLDKALDEALPEVVALAESLPQLKKVAIVCDSSDMSTFEDRLRSARNGDEAQAIFLEAMIPCSKELKKLEASRSSFVREYAAQSLDIFDQLGENLKMLGNATTENEAQIAYDALEKTAQEPGLLEDDMRGKAERLSDKRNEFKQAGRDLKHALELGESRARF